MLAAGALWAALLSQTTATCATTTTTSAAREATYVLLIGHPSAPPDRRLEALGSVGQDVLHMRQLFSLLRPVHTYVHVRLPDATMVPTRPPTRRSLLDTVDEMTELLSRAEGPAQVFVYYAGHGEARQDRPVRSEIFLEADASISDDGVLSATDLQDLILAPLAVHARVHLIVDACQSMYLLAPRGTVTQKRRVMKLHSGADPEMIHKFYKSYPNVGALLAVNGDQLTYEDRRIGGIFSYALRSAATGTADLDRDGRLSYREIYSATSHVLKGLRGAAEPGMAPPGGDYDATFMDYRDAPNAARVCFTPPVSARYELYNGEHKPFAVIYPGTTRPLNLYFERGQSTIAVQRQSRATLGRYWSFTATDGSFADLRQRLPDRESRGVTLEGELMDSPFDRDTPEADALPTLGDLPRAGYVSAGLGVSWAQFLDGGPGDQHYNLGASLLLRLGQGPHQLIAGGTWSAGSATSATEDFALSTHTLLGEAGYLHVLYEGRAELAVGVLLGAGRVLEAIQPGDRDVSAALFRGGLSADALIPVPAESRLALRMSVTAGVQYLCADGCGSPIVDPLVTVTAGVEWELPLLSR